MRKYKVGDKVKIRCDLESGRYGCEVVIPSMLNLRGRVATITRVCHEPCGIKYKLDIDTLACYWTEEMFCDVSFKFTTKDLKDGMFGLTNKGEKFIVSNGKLVYDNGCFSDILNFEENTLKSKYSNRRIDEVYEGMRCFKDLDDGDKSMYSCVYKYNIVSYTLSELKKIVGHDFEIVEE